MNELELRKQLETITPEVPEKFHRTMTATLSAIVAEETNGHADTPRNGAFGGGRLLAAALILALLLGTAAVAARHWQVFDDLWIFRETPERADEVMQADLYQTTVNGVEITVKEAGYDGRTLFLMYTYRMPDVETPLGSYREGAAEPGVYEEDYQLLYDRNVGWWIDHIWFDGVAMDMPGGSGGETSGSPVPGELVETQYWRLDNEDVQLSGEVQISLPIGERQPLEDYSYRLHPERFDEQRRLLLPEKGVVTFTFNASDMLDRVVTETPNVETVTPEVTASVSEVCYSPLMTYVTLKLEGNQEAIAAYKAENGEGFYSEDGELLWEYGGMDVFSDYVYSLALVDGKGRELFPDTYACQGVGNEWAEFVYPYLEEIPEELWMAPVKGGKADMTYAIRVR